MPSGQPNNTAPSQSGAGAPKSGHWNWPRFVAMQNATYSPAVTESSTPTVDAAHPLTGTEQEKRHEQHSVSDQEQQTQSQVDKAHPHIKTEQEMSHEQLSPSDQEQQTQSQVDRIHPDFTKEQQKPQEQLSTGNQTGNQEHQMQSQVHEIKSDTEKEHHPKESTRIDDAQDGEGQSDEHKMPLDPVPSHEDTPEAEIEQSRGAESVEAPKALDHPFVNQSIPEEPSEESSPIIQRRTSKFLELTDEHRPVPTINLEPVSEPAKVTQDSDNPDVPQTIPLITIQRPSRNPSEIAVSEMSTEPDVNPTADDVGTEVAQAIENADAQGTDLVAVMPRPTDTQTDAVLTPVRVKRHKIVLRKTRNAVARRTLLKAGLGRQLAMPTKDALRRLAKGEDVTIADIKVVG